MRFDLLNVVGSSPARLASPEAERPARAAKRSMADQTCAWVSIIAPSMPAHDRIIACAFKARAGRSPPEQVAMPASKLAALNSRFCADSVAPDAGLKV
jgi:hypothetical protein